MEKDLKTQNLLSLRAIYVGSCLAMALVQWGTQEVFIFSGLLGQQTITVAFITVIGALLSNLMPNSLKHPLVYLRFRNVLSGHRCKRICKRDSRLAEDDLARRWPKLFAQDMKESAQNSYWYREIYLSVRNAPEVLQAHRSFLLCRDAASGLFVLLVILTLWRAAAMYVPLPPPGMWSLLLNVGIILGLCQVGRQSGDRMVANAVAIALARGMEGATPGAGPESKNEM